MTQAQNNSTKAAKPKSLLIDGWEVVIGIEIHTQLATNSKNLLRFFHSIW